MKPDEFIPYAKHSITDADIEAVTQALRSAWITRGPTVEAFEKAVAEYCGARFAVAFNSGTSALIAASYAAQMTPSDRMITTPNTFVGTLVGGNHLGTPPLFIDIDRKTGNLDLDILQQNINQFSSRGRDIIFPVHFSGIPVDMARIDKMIRSPETVVIEDAAHALGSKYADGQKVGSCAWSHMTIFSFHASKQITTGEGGMVTTSNEKLFHALKLFRNNGIQKDSRYLKQHPASWDYEVVETTGNFHMTEFQAALGLSQLSRVDTIAEKRRRLLRYYREKFKDVEGVRFLQGADDDLISYHLCVIQLDFGAYKLTREQVMERLREAKIGSQVHYIPIYRHPVFQKMCGEIIDYFPQMEGYYSQALTLPLHVEMEEADIDRIHAEFQKLTKG